MFFSSIIKSVCRFHTASRQFVTFTNAKPAVSLLPRRKFCSSAENEQESKSTNHVTLTEDVIKSLTGDDPNLVKRLKLVEFEYEVSKQEGERTPSNLTLEQWKELLLLPSISKRKKYLIYLFKLEMTKQNRKQKKEEEKIRREAEKEAEKEVVKDEGEQHIEYGLGKNTMFLKIYETTMDHHRNSRILQASMFDFPVVYDLSYEEHMNAMEQKNAAKQLLLSLVANRESNQPLPMQFCNVNFNGLVMKHLLRMIPSLYNPEFPINISPKSYLDMFPREKLVYLTPHCQTEMTHFDGDRVYIIGCLVDKSDCKPHSLAKAKRENIQMAKLPLDRYLTFAGGSGKSLTLNAMISILLELREHGDWDRALKIVPRRKIVDHDNEPDMYSRMKFTKRNMESRRQVKGDLNELLFTNVPRRTDNYSKFNSSGKRRRED